MKSLVGEWVSECMNEWEKSVKLKSYSTQITLTRNNQSLNAFENEDMQWQNIRKCQNSKLSADRHILIRNHCKNVFWGHMAFNTIISSLLIIFNLMISISTKPKSKLAFCCLSIALSDTIVWHKTDDLSRSVFLGSIRQLNSRYLNKEYFFTI